MDQHRSSGRRAAGFLAGILLIAVGAWFYRASSPEAVVVYCAHDSVYADEILQRFERETGIPVQVRYDTEATKSLGLVEMLLREKASPRCDLFWNNELLGTLDLADQGVLAAYKGPGWERIPERYRDPDGRWAGFGARLRVVLVNTGRMEATREAVDAALAAEDLSPVCMAKPLYGTTLTHYAVLWEELGPEGLKAWHAEVRERGLREVPSNGAVKTAVAEGTCALGTTDTDDSFLALDAGAPVAMLPVRLEDGQTIAIPNTVALVKGGPTPDLARRLADYLLSAETEVALANGRSRQVPLGLVDESALPDEVRALYGPAGEGYPIGGLLEARNACIDWLKRELAP